MAGEAVAVASVLTAGIALVKGLDELRKTVKEYYTAHKNVQPELAGLRDGITDFALLLSETMGHVKECNRHLAPNEQECKCFERVTKSAKASKKVFVAFLVKQTELLRNRRGFFCEAREGRQWAHAQPEVALYKWNLQASKRSLQLLGDLFQWRICNYILSKIGSNPHISQDERRFAEEKRQLISHRVRTVREDVEDLRKELHELVQKPDVPLADKQAALEARKAMDEVEDTLASVLRLEPRTRHSPSHPRSPGYAAQPRFDFFSVLSTDNTTSFINDGEEIHITRVTSSHQMPTSHKPDRLARRWEDHPFDGDTSADTRRQRRPHR